MTIAAFPTMTRELSVLPTVPDELSTGAPSYRMKEAGLLLTKVFELGRLRGREIFSVRTF